MMSIFEKINFDERIPDIDKKSEIVPILIEKIVPVFLNQEKFGAKEGY